MQMDDILLQEAVERYLKNEMSEQERAYFDQLRTSTPEIDQMVVEHAMFQHEMDFYAAASKLSSTIPIISYCSRASYKMVQKKPRVARSSNFSTATNE
jgi:hypothetical protein